MPVDITNSAVGWKICAITARIKKYKSIITKKEKHNKIALLGKDQLNTIEVPISKALIDSCNSQDKFVSVNNVLKQYYEMKEEIKKSWNFCGIYYIKAIETYCVSYKKYTANKNSSVKIKLNKAF